MGQASESDSQHALERIGEESAGWGCGDREDGQGEGLGRRVQEEVDFRFASEFVTVV